LIKNQLLSLFVPALQKINKDNVSFLSRIHPTLLRARCGASAVLAKTKYGFSLYGYDEYEQFQRGHEKLREEIEMEEMKEKVRIKDIAKLRVNQELKIKERDDIFFVRQIAKVINRITEKKVRGEFCMSSMSSRNAAIKTANELEKIMINNIVNRLLEIGVIRHAGTTKKNTPYFQLVQRFTVDGLVQKYEKHMIGVAS
jgi:hypothetical protein